MENSASQLCLQIAPVQGLIHICVPIRIAQIAELFCAYQECRFVNILKRILPRPLNMRDAAAACVIFRKSG
jgi:hypothetical protein